MGNAGGSSKFYAVFLFTHTLRTRAVIRTLLYKYLILIAYKYLYDNAHVLKIEIRRVRKYKFVRKHQNKYKYAY